MIILFVLLGLIFLVSGGIGLFYVNASGNVDSASALFFLGNLGSATFVVIGLLVLVFIALFNAEFD